MNNYTELGPVPSDEPCSQLGVDADFAEQNAIETTAYKHQLERRFPEFVFVVKEFPYDTGSYKEVCVTFSTELEWGAALVVENMLPDRWDEQAVAELKQGGYRHLGVSTDDCFCR
jgi:hypothetical protein